MSDNAALPPEFETWEKCRDYYSLEALFLGQRYDRKKSNLSKRQYMAAARRATYANSRCKKPYADAEPADAE